MKRRVLLRAVVAGLLTAGLLIGQAPFHGLEAQSPAAGARQAPANANLEIGRDMGPLPTDQIIIKYRTEELKAPAIAAAGAQLDRLSRAAGIEIDYFRQMSGDSHVLKLPAELPYAEVAAIAGRLAALPEVDYAEPDLIVTVDEAAATPNDPEYPNQWYLTGAYGINAPAAWDVTTGSSNVVVAVIDTGIVMAHPDLTGRIINGYDFISDSGRANDGDGRDADARDPGDWVTKDFCKKGSGATDSTWHGTHVAGTIGAVTDNNRGVAGVSWNARVLAVRVLGRCGGATSDIADAIRWAAGLAVPGVPANNNPARVLNLSLGGYSETCPKAYEDAISATDALAAAIVAAGNELSDVSTHTPANCPGVLAVAATTAKGNKAWFSNFGSMVRISAPGEDIRSTKNGSTTSPNTTYTYVDSSGTSMATPQVAAAASLILALRSGLDGAQVRNVLMGAVTDFPAGSTCDTSICGSGILNVEEAVRDLWVNAAWPGPTHLSIGALNSPYKTVTEANSAAWNGARFRIKPGSYPGAVTISRRVEIRAEGGVVTIGK